MKNDSLRLAVVVMATLFSHVLLAQVKAVTENGQNVLLYDDGTWRSAEYLEVDKEPYVMPAPPVNGKFVEGAGTPVRKVELVGSSPNAITDTERWLEMNDLSFSQYEVPNSFRGIKGALPEGVPAHYRGKMIVKAIYSDEYLFLIYGGNFSEGRYLLITDRDVRKVLYAFDFEAYEYSPDFVEEDRMFIQQRINWADIRDGILYVSHSHNTYAESSKGMNAYITAIDLATNEVIWRTAPLVSNTSNFVIVDDIIVTGYGFTKEKDYLYTVSRSSGNVVQKVLLKTGPDAILRKGDQLYVRAYDTDYVFRIK